MADPSRSPTRWRRAIALVSDAIYTIDADSRRKGEPRAPSHARESIRLLAGLGLRELSAGHTHPVIHDVRQ